MITLLLVLVVVSLDQLTKNLIQATLNYGQIKSVIGCFNLVHVRNTGAVWGTFQHQSLHLALFSFLALTVIALMYKRLVNRDNVNRVALGLIAGGALGNLIDRLRFGWVVDFLDFYLGQYHWPAFNLADAAILSGVGLFLLTAWREHKAQTLS